MRINRFLPYIIISLTALASRLPLLEKYQSHWDGPDYSIAVVFYSLENFTPTSPGYPLYIAMGKFFHIFVKDPHTSIVLVSVLASVIGTLAFYIFGKKIYNNYVGIAASTIFLTGSTFYYFSLTPYGYLPIASFVVLLALVVYRIFVLKKQNGVLYGLVLGICFGIRPQEMFLVGPLALLGLASLNKKNKAYSILIFSVITFFWLLPLIKDSGGINNYITLNLAAATAEGFTHTFSYNLPLAIKGILLSLGISLAFLLYFPYGFLIEKVKINKKVMIFYLIWIIPGVFFNLFIRGEHAGPQLGYVSAILILVAYCLWKFTEKKKFLFYLSLFAVAAFNLYWFFYDRDPNFEKPYRPTSFHYSDIRKNDLIISSKVSYVSEHFDPKTTLLISTEASWRPYSYYLKDFEIFALYALDNKSVPYIYGKFTGQNWNQERSVVKDFSLKIPSNISRIIFMDTGMNNWIVGKNYKIVNLSGSSKITIVPVKKNSTMIYGYHFIKFLN